MKIAISIIAFAAIFLMAIPFVHVSKEDQGISYLHYREQYTHNLRKPLIKHYRELYCDLSKEIGQQEMKKKDKQ
ncbi:MAG: hypothetical protein KFB93_01930 [Simkaniaceae bacterium]|nr:MAG: hypothetical protein KFB93_01930 [Simkaniaceae bacterium]